MSAPAIPIILHNSFRHGEIVTIPAGSKAREVAFREDGSSQWFHVFTLPYDLSIEVSSWKQEMLPHALPVDGENISAIGFHDEEGRLVMVEVTEDLCRTNKKAIRYSLDPKNTRNP